MRTRSRFWLALTALAVLTSACSDTTGPGAEPDAGGTWQGSLTHPSYDGGALTLTLIDANGTVTGTYRLILSMRVGSRVGVEQSGGNVSGSFANDRLRLLLQRTNGNQWMLDGEVNRSRAEGTWTSGVGAANGTFSVSR